MAYIYHFIGALFFAVPSVLFAADSLVFALDIIRHGDRSPIMALPGIDYQWPQGLGQLTAEGMQQEYTMGLAFRKKYIDQHRLLPEHYEPGTMYVRSTDYDRTLMSAQSLLMGLYPPGTGPHTADSSLSALPHEFQPIPVFSAPAKYDEVIWQEVDSQERGRLLEKYVYSTKEWQQKDNALKDKYPLWSRLAGIKITCLKELGLVGDTLFIHQLHKAPMPADMSPEDAKAIIDISSWAFMAQERPQQIARAYHSKMMTNIANYLKHGSEENSKLKYVLLSAHDITIAGALSFLGAPLQKAPPYASNLNFSLYSNGNVYTVKINYNGNPVSIPGCGGEVCELQQFIDLVSNTSIAS